MRRKSWMHLSEDDFYQMIDAALNGAPEDYQWPTYPMDMISDAQEWLRFKRAMASWISNQDEEVQRGLDQAAREEEQGDE